MLKKKVIAGNILNLTDARYFAAWGIDYLLFDLDEIDIMTVLGIKEWVSGPKVLLLFGEGSMGLLDEAILKIEPYAIGHKGGDNAPIEYLSAHTELFDYSISMISGEENIIIEGETFTTDTVHSIGTESVHLILKGGDEDKIGFKSYDELDEILEKLEIE